MTQKKIGGFRHLVELTRNPPYVSNTYVSAVRSHSRVKRTAGWLHQSADLLPFDASVIPESCAPQLRGPKKSPSVQLGADVMSRREIASLASGEATAPRKRGPGAYNMDSSEAFIASALVILLM